MATTSELLAKARAALETKKLQEQQAQNVTVISAQEEHVAIAEQRGANPSALQPSKSNVISVDEVTAAGSATNTTAIGHNEFRDASGNIRTINNQQRAFLDKVLAGESCVLIGKAGTGKTTIVGITLSHAILTDYIKPLQNGTDNLAIGSPGCVVCAFTNKAVNNIRHQLPQDLKGNCLTIHKLLEYKPVYYTVIDPVTGLDKTKMNFEPARNKWNPLPADLKVVVIEEASMLSVDLYLKLLDALPSGCQIILLGDIRQLPPVMSGAAILGFKMIEWPVVELDEVYRQALLSPILSMALEADAGNIAMFNGTAKIKDDNGKWQWPVLQKLNARTEHGSVHIHPWQKTLSNDLALATAVKFMCSMADAGKDKYDPTEDIILCPFNVEFGTVELNKGIHQYLGVKRGATVHEVIAGYEKHYLAVGDRILLDKDDAFIIGITRNLEYMGKKPQKPSPQLNRWGHLDTTIPLPGEFVETTDDEEVAFDLEAIENIFAAATDEITDRTTKASHIIKIAYPSQIPDNFQFTERNCELLCADIIPREIDDAKSVNDLLGGNAITIHKSQGSEYGRVFLLLHESHATMVSRELLYTAFTRAKDFLYVICPPEMLAKGISRQRIKGNTLAEKSEFFKGKWDEYEAKTKQSPEERDRIEKLKQDVWIAAQAAVALLNMTYPTKERLRLNAIEYNDTGSAAGMAYFDRWCISINPLYLEKETEEVIKDVVPHEVAHLAAHKWFKDSGHGTAWQQLCKDAGGSGNIYHEMGKAADIRSANRSSNRRK